MGSYFFMGLALMLALGAIKIDGWLAALMLVICMVVSSPAIQIPDKRIKWALAGIFMVFGLLLYPDIEQYRENFENAVNTQPIPKNE